jgi:ribonuclease-3 family protein
MQRLHLCLSTPLHFFYRQFFSFVKAGVSSAKNLNAAALLFVRAEAQAEAVMKILPILTDEENAAYRRGRNIGHTNVPKSATVGQYRMATGLEALFGYLHLLGREERIRELFTLAFADQINEFTNKEN